LSAAEFGRVDADNTVFVIEAGVERQVGQYPGVTPEEALAYFVRKFEDLEAQVRLLEQRLANSTSDAKSLKAAHDAIAAELVEPKAVGDLQQLRDRVARTEPKIAAMAEAAAAERQAQVAEALAEKEAIASRAEVIVAAGDKINWKKSGAEMNTLFERWQTLQKSGAKVPKSQADPIWKRFSQARAKFERGRRAYFASLDTQFKEAKAQKEQLVERAEKLVSKGGEAATEYRNLQDSWKAAPKAGKAEDALWARFRAAGDAIFSAKKEADAAAALEQKTNLEAKLALLTEAEAIDTGNLEAARKALSDVQAKWAKIGHVPKNDVRRVEDRLRKVEKKLQDAQNEHWRRTDPAAKARSSSLIEQLEAAIADLEAQLAKKPGDKSLSEQIAARKTWLEAAQNAVD
jgi:DNA-binding transcriptional regulator YiaG